FIVLVSDFKSLILLVKVVHPHTVVIETKVHCGTFWSPKPEGYFSLRGMGTPDIHLSRITLPKITDTESYPPRGISQITGTCRSFTMSGTEPGMVSGRPFLNGKGTGTTLIQGIITKCRN